MPDFLTHPPFNLFAADLGWVTTTAQALTLPQKVAQLFNLISPVEPFCGLGDARS